MTKGKDDTGIDLGVFGRRDAPERFTATEGIAAGLSLVWLVVMGVFFLRGDDAAEGGGRLDWLVTLLAVFLPIGLIWVAAMAARATRIWREDAARLQAAIDALRHAYVTQSQAAGGAVKSPRSAAEKVTEDAAVAAIVSHGTNDENDRPTITTRPQTSMKAAPSDPQSRLELEEVPEDARNPLTPEEFIRAMNFPDDEHDKEGFRALRRALEDHDAAKLVRASQDVLTLLSQDGIYMDDFKPDRARPEIWRRFAEGERGPTVAAIGGVRDRASLALTSARMREDVIFRDAVHHFLRHFDKTLAAFTPIATDQEIADLTETRTARAFMLLGRVAGTFD